MLRGYDVSGTSLSIEPTMADAMVGVALNHDFAAGPTHSSVDNESPGSCEIRVFCHDFLNFLRDTEKLAHLRSRSLQDHFVLDERSPLHHLLTVLPNLDQATESRLRSTSRMILLLYINKALWDHQESFDKLEPFLKALENESKQTWSIEYILWLVIKHDARSGLGDPERPWFIGRMLKIAKRLSEDLWDRLAFTLLAYLRGDRIFRHSKRGLAQIDEIKRWLNTETTPAVSRGALCAAEGDRQKESFSDGDVPISSFQTHLV
jgi:hypothetical protein